MPEGDTVWQSARRLDALNGQVVTASDFRSPSLAGVDLAGVHLYGSSLDSTALSYQSSAVGHIDTWKSPVYLVQGDDDRNVDFSQTVGLVQLLRAHGIYYELTVNPDDVHESLIHGRWIDTWNHSADFLKRFVWDKQTPPVMSSAGKQ